MTERSLGMGKELEVTVKGERFDLKAKETASSMPSVERKAHTTESTNEQLTSGRARSSAQTLLTDFCEPDLKEAWSSYLLTPTMSENIKGTLSSSNQRKVFMLLQYITAAAYAQRIPKFRSKVLLILRKAVRVSLKYAAGRN